MNSNPDTKGTFKFLDAELVVRRIRPSPKIFVAHNEALSKGIRALYNMTRVELKTFTFAGGFQTLSINNAVLGALPKHLIFTMLKNTDFLGSGNSNPYNFRHYDLTSFTMYTMYTMKIKNKFSFGPPQDRPLLLMINAALQLLRREVL